MISNEASFATAGVHALSICLPACGGQARPQQAKLEWL